MGAARASPSPTGAAQQAVIREALAQAGVSPHQISYVEAHGTGTALGDPIEVRALSAVLGGDPRRTQPLWIGAVKTNIGHCEVAAGVAGLAKVVLSLQHRTIPPHLHYKQTNPHIEFEPIPAQVPTAAVPWPDGDGPRLAGLSSFGLSGTNAHFVVEEFRPALDDAEDEDAAAQAGPHVLTLSARDAAALAALAGRWEEGLAPGGSLHQQPLRDLCFTASARRTHHRHRWAAVVSSADDARRKLAAFAAGTSPGGAPPRREHLAFVFSGQGSQWWAMGRSLMAKEPVFRAALEECLELFGALGDSAVSAAFRSDEASSRVADTEVAQPALFAIQVALARLLGSWGIRPDAVIGHSAGEVAAAHVAGALSLPDAARLALYRGRVMQQATGRGRMAAVQLSADEAAALAARSGDRLAVAAINSPSSCVLSGEADALAAALAELDSRGLWHRLLPVNYAFHSQQMRPLSGQLMDAVAGLRSRAPDVPIVSTVTGAEAVGLAFDARYWGANLTEPVRFAAGIAELIAGGHEAFVEIGPQPVLRKAVVECLEAAGRQGTVLSSLRRAGDERTALLETLSALYAIGMSADWTALYHGQPRVVSLPRYPWRRRRLWLEAESVPDRTPMAARKADPSAEPGEDADPAARQARVLSYLHEVRWAPVARASGVAAEPGPWLIFADRGGTGLALAQALRADGTACELVFAAGNGTASPEPGAVVDPTSVASVRDLLRSRQAAAGTFRGIVYLWGLDAEWEAEVSPRAVCGGLLSIVQAASPAGWRARQLWIVTRGAQPVRPDAASSGTPEVNSGVPPLARSPRDRGVAAAQAPLWGMSRTIPLELPGISCVAADLDPAHGTAGAAELAEEMRAWDGTDQVAFREGQRYLPRIQALAPPPAQDGARPRSRPVPDATYLITGGGGALGLQVARWIVAEGGRHLVLMARSAPSAETAAVVEELRAAGAEVRVVQGNVARREDVAGILADIDRSMPPLRGLVHAAGTVDVAFVERQPWDHFVSVFPAKVQGAWNLHTLTRERPLDFFVMFSSTASLFGALGQASYSAANAFLDSLAHHRRAQGLPALSINWGPWAEVGMAARLGEQVRQRWASQGVGMLSPGDGVAAFAHLLRTDVAEAVALAIDWRTFVAGYPQIERVALFAGMAAAFPRSGGVRAGRREELRLALEGQGGAEVVSLLQGFVQQEFADVLGFDSPSAVDPDLGFLEMGVDSLMATRVMLSLNDALRLSLPMSLMFEHPTITALAAEVARVRADSAPASPPVRLSRRADVGEPREITLAHFETSEPAPLSGAQQGLWFASQYETDEPAYNEALVLRIEGDIDPALLARVLGEIVRRQETLRTVYREDEDGPVQVVLPAGPVDLPVEDCFGPDGPGLEWLLPRLKAEARAPFALESGPMLRARLLRIGPREHVLLLVTHHLAIDGWSYGVLARELAVLSRAFAAAVPSPLPELTVQYRDFARWQQRRLAGGALDGQLEYWQRQIAGVPVLEWPGVTRRRRTFTGAMRMFTVSREQEQALRELGRSEGATLSMTLLAVYQAWLYGYTRQTDFSVGVPVAGRPPETEPLIGLLMNVLPLRARLESRLTFRELLGRVRQAMVEALAHSDLPFNHLVQRAGVRRDARWSPVFQVMFVVENVPFPAVSIDAQHMEPIRVDFGVSKFDLAMIFEQRDGPLDGRVEYNTDMFDPGLMAAMVGHYQELLLAVIAHPDRQVGELPLGEVEAVLRGVPAYTPPRTELETALAEAWAEVLRVDRVGIHDNFFDLGGASLSALEIISRLNESGVSMEAIDPMQIFDLQTVAELAAAMAARGSAPAEAATYEGTIPS